MKHECVDDRNLPCLKCGGQGFILSYNILHDDGWIYDHHSGKSVKRCPNFKPEPVRQPAVSWDKIWMRLAQDISSKSTCNVPNRDVGCVIVSEDNTKVLALGYNGSAKGDDNGCDYAKGATVTTGLSRCTCVHAEMNALTKLDTSNPIKKKMYLTISPCGICYKLIVNAGINEVIYLQEYNKENLEKLILRDVKVRSFEL